MNYVHTGKNRPIKVYTSVDTRFILADFFAKLAIFTRKREGKETPSIEGGWSLSRSMRITAAEGR
jgi:hypothetical protein